MSGHELSCAQRIRQKLAERDGLYANLWRRLDAPDAADDDADALYQELEPLGVDVRPVVSIQLSWGGPADWLEIELENDSRHEIRRVTYHFADWFDHAEREVTQREAPALWRAAEHYADGCRWNLADLIEGMT